MKKPSEILGEFTKKEILEWLDSQFLRPFPEKSEMLFIRWKIKTKEHEIQESLLRKEFEAINLSLRQEYAEKFNASNDHDEKMKLIEKMVPFDEKLSKFFKKSESLNKKYWKIQEIYKSAERQRKIEREQRNCNP